MRARKNFCPGVGILSEPDRAEKKLDLVPARYNLKTSPSIFKIKKFDSPCRDLRIGNQNLWKSPKKKHIWAKFNSICRHKIFLTVKNYQQRKSFLKLVLEISAQFDV